MEPETIERQSKRVTPLVTVDIIIENMDGTAIVLILRKNEPHGYALPGGFVDVGETTIQAAIREAEEETSLKITNVKQFHTYSDPKRDPRGHAITVAYIGQAVGNPEGQDDAEQAFWCKTDESSHFGTQLRDVCVKLCFDHRQIIQEYLHFKKTGERPTRE